MEIELSEMELMKKLNTQWLNTSILSVSHVEFSMPIAMTTKEAIWY